MKNLSQLDRRFRSPHPCWQCKSWFLGFSQVFDRKFREKNPWKFSSACVAPSGCHITRNISCTYIRNSQLGKSTKLTKSHSIFASHKPRLHCRDPQSSPSSGASCSLFVEAGKEQQLKSISKRNAHQNCWFMLLVNLFCFATYWTNASWFLDSGVTFSDVNSGGHGTEGRCSSTEYCTSPWLRTRCVLDVLTWDSLMAKTHNMMTGTEFGFPFWFSFLGELDKVRL